jgi:hypothetical protein
VAHQLLKHAQRTLRAITVPKVCRRQRIGMGGFGTPASAYSVAIDSSKPPAGRIDDPAIVAGDDPQAGLR